MPSSQVFKKWKAGQLHSGSKQGPPVKSHAQAVAIYLSEKRAEQKHGGRYPEKKASGGHVKGLAAAVDQAHRTHAGRPHPSTIDYKGKTYNLGKALGGPNLSMENMILRGSSYGLRHEGMINSSVPGRTDRLPMSVKSGSYVLPADIPSALGQGNSMAGGQILKKMFSSGPYGLSTMHGGHGSGQPKMRMMSPPRMPKAGFAEGGASDTPPLPIDPNKSVFNTWYDATGRAASDGSSVGLRAVPRDLRDRYRQQRGYAAGGTKGEPDSHVPIVAAGGEFLIHPDVVRDIGHGNINAGHKVLDKFVMNIRKKYAETLKKLPGPKK